MKHIKTIAIIALYFTVAIFTARHQGTPGNWQDLNNDASTKSFVCVSVGLIWPVLGVFVWADVVLPEQEVTK